MGLDQRVLNVGKGSSVQLSRGLVIVMIRGRTQNIRRQVPIRWSTAVQLSLIPSFGDHRRYAPLSFCRAGIPEAGIYPAMVLSPEGRRGVEQVVRRPMTCTPPLYPSQSQCSSGLEPAGITISTLSNYRKSCTAIGSGRVCNPPKLLPV